MNSNNDNYLTTFFLPFIFVHTMVSLLSYIINLLFLFYFLLPSPIQKLPIMRA